MKNYQNSIHSKLKLIELDCDGFGFKIKLIDGQGIKPNRLDWMIFFPQNQSNQQIPLFSLSRNWLKMKKKIGEQMQDSIYELLFLMKCLLFLKSNPILYKYVCINLSAEKRFVRFFFRHHLGNVKFEGGVFY